MAGRAGQTLAVVGEKRARFAELIREGVSSAEACRVVGVHPRC